MGGTVPEAEGYAVARFVIEAVAREMDLDEDVVKEAAEGIDWWPKDRGHGDQEIPGSTDGDATADMGYEPFNLGWQEIDQLGRMLVAIEGKDDVEALIAGLMADEEEELEEARRRRRPPERPAEARRGSGWWIHWPGTVPEGPFSSKADAERWYRAERARGSQPALILPTETP